MCEGGVDKGETDKKERVSDTPKKWGWNIPQKISSLEASLETRGG